MERIRSGDEPMHARSPLRLRLGLACFGVANGVAGIVVFAVLGSAVFVAVCVGLAVVASLDVGVVVYRIRQGPHFQPGRAVPPYRPVDPPPGAAPRAPVGRRVRHRRYLVMMGACMFLVVNAWVWVRWYSVGWAVGLSVLAAVLPPIAAVVSNTDSPILRGGADSDDDQDAQDASLRWPDYPPASWSRPRDHGDGSGGGDDDDG